jgi:hypothetical protein
MSSSPAETDSWEHLYLGTNNSSLTNPQLMSVVQTCCIAEITNSSTCSCFQLNHINTTIQTLQQHKQTTTSDVMVRMSEERNTHLFVSDDFKVCCLSGEQLIDGVQPSPQVVRVEHLELFDGFELIHVILGHLQQR